MRILPVLDLKHGTVVRGIAGRRDEYRPIVSPLVASARPLDVARAFRDHFGLNELYVADLDAICGERHNCPHLDGLVRDGFRVWLDAGFRTAEDARGFGNLHRLVVGLETLEEPAELRRIEPERLVFSLDLKQGQPLAKAAQWRDADAWRVASDVIAFGVRQLLVLDLARVGVSDGTGTEELCARLHDAFPEVELTAGGGVRGPGDVARLGTHGVRNVLVATALHDGRITRDDLRRLGGP